MGDVGSMLSRATRGVFRSPWLALPLAVLVALSLLESLAQRGLPAWAASTFDTLAGLATPAFLALWVGFSQDAASGRKLQGRDVGPVLIRCAPAMYIVIFILSIGSELLGALGGLATLAFLVPLVFNPWIDLACLTGVSVDRVSPEMHKGTYWITAAIGILLVFIAAAAMDMSLTSYSLPALNLFRGIAPWVRLIVGYAIMTWLWAVRSLILGEGGSWPSARKRRWQESMRQQQPW